MNLDLDKSKSAPLDKSKIINTILIITIIILGIVLFNKQLLSTKLFPNNAITKSYFDNKQYSSSKNKILVDIEGAVVNPGVYEVEDDKRINDVVILAGGFTKEVNAFYVTKNINKAQKLADGLKIYIPTINDPDVTLQEGSNTDNSVTTASIESAVNINSATKTELDKLPGIGEVTANKIIDNRPFSNKDDLVNKKVLTKSQLDKILPLIIF